VRRVRGADGAGARGEAPTALLEGWLAEWYAPAYRTARLILGDGAEAEDAVQDAFLRLWRFRDAIPEGEAARAWLYRVVVNACYSRARSERRHEMSSGDESLLDGLAEQGAGPDEKVAGALSGTAVRAAIAALPEALRVPVVLRYYADLSEREIALAIHRRAGTVKSRLHEARRRLGADPTISRLLGAEEA